MKICSAWNWDTLEYTYYRCPGDHSPGGWQRPELDLPAPSGAAVHIEDLLPTLPAGCVEIGRGAAARGQIVKPVKSGTGLGVFGAVAEHSNLIVAGTVGLVAVAALWGFFGRK